MPTRLPHDLGTCTPDPVIRLNAGDADAVISALVTATGVRPMRRTRALRLSLSGASRSLANSSAGHAGEMTEIRWSQ